jgi:hypothetical protein
MFASREYVIVVSEDHSVKVAAVNRRRVLEVGQNHYDALQAAQRSPECPPREQIALVFIEDVVTMGVPLSS